MREAFLGKEREVALHLTLFVSSCGPLPYAISFNPWVQPQEGDNTTTPQILKTVPILSTYRVGHSDSQTAASWEGNFFI